MGKVVSFAGTKGGTLKSTLTQCITTSKGFEKYKVAILEVDRQKSLSSWAKERDKKLPPLNVTIYNYQEDNALKDEIQKYKEQYDFLFVDLPGESEALTHTRTALAFSDLCIFPLRLSHKDTTAFDTNMRLPLTKILSIRGGQHFKILPIFAHHSVNAVNFRKNFEAIKIVEKFKNIHRDRTVYTYFSMHGLTLREYSKCYTGYPKEGEKALKAIKDIELIAQEIIEIINKLKD